MAGKNSENKEHWHLRNCRNKKHKFSYWTVLNLFNSWQKDLKVLKLAEFNLVNEETRKCRVGKLWRFYCLLPQVFGLHVTDVQNECLDSRARQEHPSDWYQQTDDVFLAMQKDKNAYFLGSILRFLFSDVKNEFYNISSKFMKYNNMYEPRQLSVVWLWIIKLKFKKERRFLHAVTTDVTNLCEFGNMLIYVSNCLPNCEARNGY